MQKPVANQTQINGIVVFENGADVRLDVRTDGETVWLTQEQMCKLFGRNQSVISRHIANAMREGEIDESNIMQNLHNIPRRKPLLFYNLDVDHAEIDIQKIQAGVKYLIEELSTPPPDPPRRKIGFIKDAISK